MRIGFTVSLMKRIWLRAARRRARLTQAELAACIGKPQSYISRLETINDDPTLNEAKAIGKALDVDPLALRFGPRVRVTARRSAPAVEA